MNSPFQVGSLLFSLLKPHLEYSSFLEYLEAYGSDCRIITELEYDIRQSKLLPVELNDIPAGNLSWRI
ncbi:hypothetical protein JW979_02280 [bacterium]|nr:hypothetical protein [candidate division CSSED10-310 bacterium]